MKLIYATFLLLVVSFANAAEVTGPAQFAGDWLGTGVYQLSGVQSYCASFKMKFNGSRYLMDFVGGSRDCEHHSETFGAVSMAYDNGDLKYNGQVIGTIKGNVLEAHFSMPEGNGNVRHWRMSMRREGSTIVYEESRTMNDEQTPLISFAGLLKN